MPAASPSPSDANRAPRPSFARSSMIGLPSASSSFRTASRDVISAKRTAQLAEPQRRRGRNAHRQKRLETVPKCYRPNCGRTTSVTFIVRRSPYRNHWIRMIALHRSYDFRSLLPETFHGKVLTSVSGAGFASWLDLDALVRSRSPVEFRRWSERCEKAGRRAKVPVTCQ